MDPPHWLLLLLLCHQVPCRGRGESPDPLAVNMAVWEMRKSLAAQPNLYILVHCTHGFNRSGALRRTGRHVAVMPPQLCWGQGVMLTIRRDRTLLSRVLYVAGACWQTSLRCCTRRMCQRPRQGINTR